MRVPVILTAGQVHDSTQLKNLLDGERCENVLADRAYDSNNIRIYIEEMGANPVIAGKKNRIQKIEYDKYTYKERHLVENFFQFIKCFRHTGTRYEMHAQNFRGMIAIACILQWAIF